MATRVKSGFVAKHGAASIVASSALPLRPRPTFPHMTGDADDIAMKRIFLLAPAAVVIATLAACGSSSGPSARDPSQPMIYVSSQRAPAYIASCLQSRLSRVRLSRVGSATEIAVGSDSNNSYFVTLTPSNAGSVIKVMHGANAPDDPPEAEMRFNIARCAT
nr:sugar ABC transporter ATPase [Burkholderia sp. WSM2230]